MNKEIHIAVIDSGLVTNLLCETARICEYTTLHLKNQMDSNQWELEICRDGNPIETGEISHGTLVVNTVLKYTGDIPLAFHIYDVFDEKDASAGSVLLEALNMILKEDIDIVVMSLTCSSQYENDFIELSGKLKEKNVLMFCSDSNDGRTHCPANLDFIYGVTGDKADASGGYTYEVGKKIQFHCDLSGEFVGDPGKYHFFVGTSKATAMVAGKLAKYLYENGRNALIDYLSCDQEEWDARTEEFDAGCVNSKLLVGDVCDKWEDGDIIFDKVSFAYNNRNILTDFTLRIPQNSKIGIIGESGMGKTTIIKLLMGYYDTYEGNIKIGEKSIRNISKSQLCSNIFLIPQNTAIFKGTVYENIVMFNGNISRESVYKACRQAGLDKFLENNPEGIDYMLESSGKNISKGEAQRIALARFFIQKADVLILDEATCNLDANIEKKFMDTIYSIKDKTIIIISHNRENLIKCDNCIEINGNKSLFAS